MHLYCLMNVLTNIVGVCVLSTRPSVDILLTTPRTVFVFVNFVVTGSLPSTFIVMSISLSVIICKE